MTTVGQVISRVRNVLKAVKEDPFLTDRTIYYAIVKYAQALMKREDVNNRLMKLSSIFNVLPNVELVEVDKIEASCAGIQSGCIIKRSRYKMPGFLDALNGPVIRTVSSLDGSIELYRTDPGTYTSMTKLTSFKYNNRFYFWFLNGYLYFPKLEWDAVRVEGAFEGSIAPFLCEDDPAKCSLRQDEQTGIPEYLYAEVEQMVIQELTTTMKVPANGADDNQNVLR
tara:strand:+ start:2873 stop:3547 length:675 start_codon:yes stop_codon:yes gene_type:complete